MTSDPLQASEPSAVFLHVGSIAVNLSTAGRYREGEGNTTAQRRISSVEPDTAKTQALPGTDAELIRSVAAGDAAALRILYERHAKLLSVRLWRRCGDPQIVEEVVQDTFLAAWRGADSYQARGPVAAWLWGIAIRTLAKRFRSEKGTTTITNTELGSPVTWEETVVAQIDFVAAMGKLSPDLHNTFEAVAIDGLSMHEASSLLGVPEGTIKSRMHRARLTLQEELR